MNGVQSRPIKLHTNCLGVGEHVEPGGKPPPPQYALSSLVTMSAQANEADESNLSGRRRNDTLPLKSCLSASTNRSRSATFRGPFKTDYAIAQCR